MTCDTCASSVEAAVAQVPGVNSVSVSLQKEMASIHFSPEEVTPLHLKEAINDMGYEAKLQGESGEF